MKWAMEPVQPDDLPREPLPTLDYAPPPEAVPIGAGCVLIAMGSVIGAVAGAFGWVLLFVFCIMETLGGAGAGIAGLAFPVMTAIGMALGGVIVLKTTRRKL